MTRGRLTLLAALALGQGLSCSFGAPPPAAPAATGALAEADAPLGPSAVDAVERELAEFQTRLAPAELRAAAAAIVEESARNDLDRELVLALMRVESGYNNFARSPVGALGLMQVMPETGRAVAAELEIEWRGPDTLFDPVANVRIGTAYLAWLTARYDGDLDRALAAYNWGPAAIDRRVRGGRPLPVVYTGKVMTALQSTARP